MAYDQINIEPAFTQSTVPCEGEVGVLSGMAGPDGGRRGGH